jgi:hypothetical protein
MAAAGFNAHCLCLRGQWKTQSTTACYGVTSAASDYYELLRISTQPVRGKIQASP